MAEAQVIQDKVDQINFLFEDNQPPIQSFQVSNPEPDLNLRLSLGGIYNTKQNQLTRSSSIAGEVVNPERNFIEHLEDTLPKSYLSLARSCSLPVEVETSKRMVNMKEFRAMKRVEAKKRAEEKQRNAVKGSDKEKLLMAATPPCLPTEIPAWAAASAAKNPALHKAIDMIKEGFRKLEGLDGSGTQSSSNPTKPEPEISSEAKTTRKFLRLEPENSTKRAKLSNGWIQDNVMKKMPSVTTTGDGPNGKKIEGFLYKYTKGQVSIVCVCHGSFLSPEEFVKHAGGKDVTNPMKQINVCSTSFSY